MFKPTLATLVIVVFAFLLSGCAGAGADIWKAMTFISDAQIKACVKKRNCGRGYRHDDWAKKDRHAALIRSVSKVESALCLFRNTVCCTDQEL